MHLVLAVFLILTKQTCIPWNPPEDVIRELQTVNKVMFLVVCSHFANTKSDDKESE